jgi:hypothetical protein
VNPKQKKEEREGIEEIRWIYINSDGLEIYSQVMKKQMKTSFFFLTRLFIEN